MRRKLKNRGKFVEFLFYCFNKCVFVAIPSRKPGTDVKEITKNGQGPSKGNHYLISSIRETKFATFYLF